VDRSDKPAYIRDSLPRNTTREDTFHRNQLRSLQAVDRAVGALIDKLQTLGLLDNTVIIYTSDNGFLWGEHGLSGKGQPYEESIRVPLIVVAPGVAPREDDSLVVSNLDVPTTIWHLAGLPTATDGLNLLPLLHDPHLSWRPEGVFLEHFSINKVWAGWRTRTYKYVEHATGERELYDLVADSYELENVVTQPAYRDIVDRLAQCIAARKGLAITVVALPPGTVGIPYAFQMTAWGGTLPYTWSIRQGTLPEGLTLDGPSGLIHGVPIRSETLQVEISVHDASLTTQRQEPQRFVMTFALTIGAPGLLQEISISPAEPNGLLQSDADDDEEDSTLAQ
jgi:hypothetical protein